MWLGSFLTLVLLFPGVLFAAEVKEIDSIVAVIDDDLVMRSELDRRTKQIVLQIKQKGLQQPPKEVVEKQVLERLIVRRLQINAAKAAGISVDEGIIGRTLGNLAEKNRMSLGQFRQALESSGLSFEQFKEDMREEYLISRLHSQNVLSKIQVSDREIDAYLEKEAQAGDEDVTYRVGHILIAVPEGAESDKLVKLKSKADRLAVELRGGTDFRDIAAKYSDASNALDGGDLGWRKRGELPSQLVDEVVKLKSGEVSDPIRSSSGFHILKLLDRKGLAREVVNQTHVRHILLRTDEVTSDEEAKTRLEQLRQRIAGGDDFAALARSHSNDAASAVKGGDLGWLSPGDVFPTFQQEMDALQPNEISKPFHTQAGWHLLQVLERRVYDSTDDVRRNKARAAIKQRKGDEAIEQFVRRLRDESYVEIRLRKDSDLD
ncbi:MAG: peptidylprolyl isomerase [Gammaproteobacteria bacterium]|nr:peptidylprolyl isomerase [Gammaproteobacteria bacterium]MBU1654732.1 peptidylprolyl isomerase [Gammaproteobacteria bacterium]MBU1959653.1 peptidylprolyl isomerase [Gammaproteobacteria bacterium]